MCSKTQSAFNGAIEELPGIYVDNFENAAVTKARAYFLSHCHTDHMQGLNSTNLLTTLNKTGAKIYTSELTAKIIQDDVNKRISEHVRSLKIGSTMISLPSSPEEDIPEMFVTVTLIPASHSTGSTMFLFKTTTKSILFTGDFRMNTNDLPKYAALHEDDVPIKLDSLYVDTTFLGHNYENFPKRSESIEKMCHEIKKWLNLEHNAIAIHTSAKYGYEFAFNEIFRRLGQKVYVPLDRWKLYSSMPHLVPGVTNDEKSTRIHLCKKRTNDHGSCVKTEFNFLYIRLSAMKWIGYKEDSSPIKYVNKNSLDVCFATHCSRSELLYFINYLCPANVIGFPNRFKSLKRKIDSE